MAATVPIQSRENLTFFEVERNVNLLKFTILAIGLIAAGGAAYFALMRSNFTQITFIATVSTLGFVSLVSFLAFFYLWREFPVFPEDQAFLNKYETFADFYEAFGWKPFLNDQISGMNTLVRKHFAKSLFYELDSDHELNGDWIRLLKSYGTYDRKLGIWHHDRLAHLFCIFHGGRPQYFRDRLLVYFDKASFKDVCEFYELIPDPKTFIPEIQNYFTRDSGVCEQTWIQFKSDNANLFK